jgi:poly-gamma-glutamate capsule biosynthesis protein CapA/YwtB (metallophosphatase superfamily)
MKIYFSLFIILFSCKSLQAQIKDTITVIGVGDIMMGSNYPNDSALPPNDGSELMKDVEAILKNADVTVGNLEGVLLDQGGVAKTCRNPKVCYVFRSPERYVQNLVNAGFDALSLANNHAGDFGEVGMQSSMRTLENVGLYYAGQTSKPYTIFEKDGIKYGFIAFAPNTGCNNINDLPAAKKMVAHLDSISDIIIVSFHGGAEGPEHQRVTRKNELFYSENRGNVYQFAHAVIDAGADVVFGHGPHVSRAVEVYKDRFIAYSLGNFCTYAGINVSGVSGLSPIVKVFTNRNGLFLTAKITSTQQTFMSPVKLDSQNQVLKRIQALTKSDFPEGVVNIDDEGWIRKSTK